MLYHDQAATHQSANEPKSKSVEQNCCQGIETFQMEEWVHLACLDSSICKALSFTTGGAGKIHSFAVACQGLGCGSCFAAKLVPFYVALGQC